MGPEASPAAGGRIGRDDGRRDRAGDGVVRRSRARPALAPPDAHGVGRDGLGVHAAADPGRAGAAGLRDVAGALADPGCAGCRAGRRGGSRLGTAGLPATGAAAARGGDGDGRAARRARCPTTRPSCCALPGVGAYTAAAVAAFAYGRRTLVLDTNVRRVLGRVLRGEASPVASAPGVGERDRGRGAAAGGAGRRGRLVGRRHGARRAGLHRAVAALRRVPGQRPAADGWPAGRPVDRRSRATRPRPTPAPTGRYAAGCWPCCATTTARCPAPGSSRCGPSPCSASGRSTGWSPTGWSCRSATTRSRCPASRTR